MSHCCHETSCGRGLFVWPASVIAKMATGLPQLHLHWLLHMLLHAFWLHRLKTRGRVRSDTAALSQHSTYRHSQSAKGNDEAVLMQCLDAFFNKLAVGGSDIPRGEGVRGAVCVSVLLVTCC